MNANLISTSYKKQTLDSVCNNIDMMEHVRDNLYETLFPVEKRPLPYIKRGFQKSTEHFGEILTTGNEFIADFEHETNRSMIVNKTNESFISVVSKNYTVVENIKIIAAINEMVKRNLEQIQIELISATMFSDSRTKYVFLIPGLKKQILGEMVIPRLTVINSYGGESSFKIIGGVNVLVCTNGLMFPKTVLQYRRMHQGQIVIEDLLNKFVETAKESDRFAEKTFGLLKGIKYTPDFLVKTMNMFNQQSQNDFVEVLATDIEHKEDYYGLLQAGTNVITHKMDRDKEVTHNLESTFIPKIINYANRDKYGQN